MSMSSVDDALECYQAVLNGLNNSESRVSTLLQALIQRDQVAASLKGANITADTVQRVSELDNRLRQAVPALVSAEWSAWRLSIDPPAAHWWWYLDEHEREKAGRGSLGWLVLSSVLVTVALGLAIDIVRRLWSGGPDPLATVAATLSVLLTASPLTKRGRELAEWLMSKIPWLLPRYRSKALLGIALVGLVGVAVIRFVALPSLALYYNNRGYRHLRSGQLTLAGYDLQRAVSLNPEFAAAYYNLASLYEQIVQYDQAIELYATALEHDFNLDLLYNNLGRLYIVQDEHDRAIALLRQGLTQTRDDGVTHALFTNLGRAYYELERYREAEAVLARAIGLKGEDAAAHCYLALTCEALELPSLAFDEWESCLRYTDQQTAEGGEWASRAKAHLQDLQEREP